MSAQDDELGYERYARFCAQIGVTPRSFEAWNAKRVWNLNDPTMGNGAFPNVDKVKQPKPGETE